MLSAEGALQSLAGTADFAARGSVLLSSDLLGLGIPGPEAIPTIQPGFGRPVLPHAGGNERGNWAAGGGAYDAASPGNAPPTYSSLPMDLTDFEIELDVLSVRDGGVWLRSPGVGAGVLLVTGGGGSGLTGLYWHVVATDGNYGPSLGVVSGLFAPGDDIHLRIAVSGTQYAAYLNGSPTPATTLDTGVFASGRAGLYDFSSQTFDNVVVIPEPGLAGCLLLGAFALRRRS